MEKGMPYWLIREPGKPHGFGTVTLDDAITSSAAIDAYITAQEPEDLMLLFGRSMKPDPEAIEAVLVTLTYDESNQPVVTEVK